MGGICHFKEWKKDEERVRNGTVLSRRVEELENAGEPYKIKWSKGVLPGTMSCDLCTAEKM